LIVSAELSPVGGLNTETGSDETDADLGPMWGAGLTLRFPMGAAFTLGPSVALCSWNTVAGSDRDDSRSVSLDVGADATLGHALGDVWPYLRIPFGLSFTFIDEDRFDPPAVSVTAEPGFHFGVMLGAELRSLRPLDLFVDVGWLHRDTGHEVEVMGFGGPYAADYQLISNELKIRIGGGVEL